MSWEGGAEAGLEVPPEDGLGFSGILEMIRRG